ncbi:RagB/SusD family nutrient uptake outer membrane protein [Marinoscillum furvescens]|uniref:Putative outer membrane starch-binding protein n=1 Tax=Marinoscillum furvescens DSM 4134 TaxID=1122208 RepID=A0A3D9L0T0_MARFU|nr:RagB/SusD family nutrient uptake outer membrane protein [Marinoscillum furvescens]RED95235.1 putative outer membrane starch-binding protein [Marinoscillum furvescens DSM 4134]
MKTLKYILLLAVLGSTMGACDEKEFLEEVNPNAITAATFWKSPDHFGQALHTVYGALQFGPISGAGLGYELARADIAGSETWYRPYQFRTFGFSNNYIQVANNWNAAYVGIFRANQVIQYINENEIEGFAPGQKEEIEAQARFIRAFLYFDLAYDYNGAVIHTTVPGSPEEFSKPFSPRSEVIAQVVLPDLEFAEQHLPAEWTGEDIGRATWGAAVSMIGKVHLYQEEWDQAASHFKEVIDSEVYRLVDNVRHNYTDENEFNEESIFEVNFSDTKNPGTQGSVWDNDPYTSGSEATTIPKQYATLQFGGFNTLVPTYYLLELFEYDEMDPNDPDNTDRTQSMRLNATLLTKDADGLYYGLPPTEKAPFNIGQAAYVKKHTNWYQYDGEDPLSRSGINFRHIRLADVYLMYAEAVLEAQGAAGISEAVTYIDLVRDRAGVITLQEYMDANGGMIPELHISVQVHGPRTYTPATAEALLTHIKLVERPIELCYEGHRWKDLVRWGMVQSQFDQLRADEEWRMANIASIEGQPPLNLGNQVHNDFEIAQQLYTPSEHNYFPVPDYEIQVNENLIPGQ